jgi:UDP-GlcNAc:undecaprenyl-phosphate GlcNAc-1-phosphate transferase
VIQFAHFDFNIYVMCAATFAVALIVCLLFTPLVRRMAFKVGAFDQPDGDRRVHVEPTPRLGGIAIYLSFMLSLFVILNIALNNNLVIVRFLSDRDLAHIIGLLFGGTLMMGVGLWDDIMHMSPQRKFAAQFVVALIATVLYGFTIYHLKIPFIGPVDLAWFGIPFSLFWYLGMVNAINFLDGLDGLVAGYTAIACVSLAIVSIMHGQYLVAIIASTLAGSALGFLPYNYNPARIFMGDSGALFIGFVLASIGVMGTEKEAVAISLAVPLLVLALPILDTASVIVRRIRNRTPVFAADREHMHHRLLDLGLSQRQAVMLFYAVGGLLGAAAIAISRFGGSRIF